jgi:amino acid transporter
MKKALILAIVVVVVIVITVILYVGHAIVVETIPWNAGLIPPDMSPHECDPNREKTVLTALSALGQVHPSS